MHLLYTAPAAGNGAGAGPSYGTGIQRYNGTPAPPLVAGSITNVFPGANNDRAFTRESVDEAINALDTNGDDYLTYDQFIMFHTGEYTPAQKKNHQNTPLKYSAAMSEPFIPTAIQSSVAPLKSIFEEADVITAAPMMGPP